MRISTGGSLRVCRRLIWMALAVSLPVCAQTGSAPPAPDGQADLTGKIDALTASLDQTRAELSESREEIRQLRSMLEQVMQKVGPLNAASPAAAAPAPEQAEKATPSESSQQIAANEPKPAQISQEDWDVTSSRLQEQAQDKVESSLKYRIRLSGIVLFNAFSVSGQVDNLDVPNVALPSQPGESSGSVGASLRQTVLGLSGTGPEILGAKTSGDVQMDFFGGLPAGYGSTTSGLMRLRLARIRFDWENTSVIGGLDVPFFSPNMPTSYMSLAEPSFAASGNLWTWTPGVRVEHRFNAGSSQLKVEAGVLDPSDYVASESSARYPNANESSRRPAAAVRLSVGKKSEDHPITFGVSGIYSPQQYASVGTTVSGWGTVADWKVALVPHTELSGEFFVGKGLDSFGGVPGPFIQPQNIVAYYGSGAPEALASITMAGGWSQLKVRVNARHEFNVAVGTGGRNASDLRYQSENYSILTSISPRNDMFLVNYIFRPRSDLVFSPEFRRLRTFQFAGPPVNADQAGFAAGFLF
jgi:hypothetical protein